MPPGETFEPPAKEETAPTGRDAASAPGDECGRFQVLSLDGGGIRGLFSAAILAAAEEDLGCRLVDHFDLIAGTSTGGIIAVALGLGLRPAEIVQFYLRHAPRVFSDPAWLRSALHWGMRKYSVRPLEAALRETFGDRTFGSSEKRLVIPAYNLGEDDVYLFRTPHSPQLRRDFRVPAWQVAAATAAAPTYFPAYRRLSEMRLVDGGVWANNPAMVALVESHATLEVPLDQIAMLSVGTYDAVVSRPARLDWSGLLGWAKRAPDILLRAGSIGVNNHVRFFLGKRLLRLDVRVPESDTTLDRVSDMGKLLARAAHHSRLFMPQLHDEFMAHRAAPYEPLYPDAKELS